MGGFDSRYLLYRIKKALKDKGFFVILRFNQSDIGI